MEQKCLFCKIISGEIPAYKIFENEHFLAFLDIKPINLGHTLLVPKIHNSDLFDLSPQISHEWGEVIQKVAMIVKKGTKAEGINLGMNNGLTAGQEIFHTHWHIIPRFKEDGLNHWLGQDNISNQILEKTKNDILQSN